jgi:hypothetical protein
MATFTGFNYFYLPLSLLTFLSQGAGGVEGGGYSLKKINQSL